MVDFDVVVVGSGAAGLCAALEAADAGSSVLVIDSEEVVGGSSRLSGGIIMGAGTKLQAALGIEDSPDSLFHDYMSLNQWKLEPAVVRRLADECGPSVDWLVEHGVRFMDRLYYSGDERVPRCHIPVAEGIGGTGVIDALYRACRQRPTIEWALNRRIDRILMEDGVAVGVAVDDDQVHASAVVLATGGYGANPDLLAAHFPDTAAGGDWNWYIGAESSRGDVLDMADQIGAQLIGDNRGLLLLEPDFGKRLEISVPGWLMIVNSTGRRFFDETAPYSVTQPLVQAQPGPVYAIFDDGAKRAALSGAATKKKSIPAAKVQLNWIEPVIDEMIAAGVVRQAPTIAELAELIGVPIDNLEGTVDGYNIGAAFGRDPYYLKDGRLIRPINQGPFYATELRLSVIAVTSHGLRIDPEARVQDRRTLPIPGLFAAGECTGGVLGATYVGSGNSWANCVTYGRIAGRSAAARSRRAEVGR